ncbi:MAG TPA: choice-of-anchor D domain-containing protein [Candidatus Eremiobacteraceae bacterium]|nr:choice-of-anchor D domain-containing protein [Candidatus Eremiobacteraceae bacterium]
MKKLLMPAPALTTSKKVAFTLLCCTVLMIFAANLWADEASGTPDQCSAPTLGPGTGAVGSAIGTATCGVVITVTASGATFAFPGNGNPYDGTEDTLVGIQNNSGGSLSSITLTSGTDSFGFDGDGPCFYNASDCFGPTGYEGPDNTFTGINNGATAGTVVFTTPIPNGGSTWFALEGSPSGQSGVVVTYTLTVTEMGLGAGTVTDTVTVNMGSPQPGPISCTEAGGVQSGTCSEIDGPGTSVTLTAMPNGSSTFGGWGGACASIGTTIAPYTCTLTNSGQTVTADFIAPPVSFNFMVNPGTNVTESALLCYGQAMPAGDTCNDPNASQLTIMTPVVMKSFPLTVEVTEFSDNGLCGQNDSVTTKLACRFGSFFNYGTDLNGNTIAPLPYTYANGNSLEYLLYDTNSGPHSAFPAGFTSGDFYLDFGFLNVSAINNLPSYWAGGTPRVFDDPDGNEFPPLPYGTDCSTAMLGSNGQPYLNSQGQEIFCQFDEDVTTFFTPGASLNSPIGGKIPPTNNLVVAFLPTTTGMNPVQMPQSNSAPAIAGSCVNGCTVSGSTITFTEGAGGTFEVSITGGFPAPTLSGPSMSMLPAGLTFTASTGTISGTPADGAAGNYPISFSATNGVGSPATLSYTLTVAAAPLTITASSGSMTYGGTVPTITPIYSGLVNGDTAASPTPPNCTTTATSTSLPGNYPSTCSGAVDPNYTISYVPGTVTVLGIDISPLTVNFGNLYLDQIGVRFVTLKNTTNAPITINSITLVGGSANGDYGDLTFCPPMIFKLPATLPAGKSCAIGVGIFATAPVFSPTASTTYLTINDSAATQQVLLTALVTDPQVSLSSTSLSFGNQKTGTTSTPPQEVTLKNSGLTPLTLTGVTISPTANFALPSGAGTNCTTLPTLSPGGTCLIYVNFTPTKKGTKYSGSVTITDLTLFGKQTISLSGTGD